MCGRYSIAIEKKEIEKRFGAKFTQPFKLRYNAAPSQDLPAILNRDPERLAFTHWGIKPVWLSKVTKKDGLINVRFETLRDKHTFKKDLEERRCLIPADGFYEWKLIRGKKVPFRITRQDGGLFAFAGLWEEHTEDGEPMPRFAIITTEADELMRPIHTRMPVILDRAEESDWLSGKQKLSDLLEMLSTPRKAKLTSFEVSDLVNNARVDEKDLIERIK